MSGIFRSKPIALWVSERESATAMSALMTPSLAAGAHPRGELAERFAVVNDHRLDEEVLAGEQELPARLRRGDRGSRHQLRHLADGVGAEAVVVKMVGHWSVAPGVADG